MTIKDKIKKKLEDFPQFRERRFRSTRLAILSLRDLDLEDKHKESRLTLEDLVAFAKKYDSYRHEWDKVMEENPELRGQDYGDKKIVEQEWQLAHGYEPGLPGDVKRLGRV